MKPVKSRNENVSKRVYVTLPDTIHADLEAWATTRGQAIATLGAIAIEFAVRRAKEDGEFISPSLTQPKQPVDLPTEKAIPSQALELTQKWVRGDPLKKGELDIVANLLGVEPEDLVHKQRMFAPTKESANA